MFPKLFTELFLKISVHQKSVRQKCQLKISVNKICQKCLKENLNINLFQKCPSNLNVKPWWLPFRTKLIKLTKVLFVCIVWNRNWIPNFHGLWKPDYFQFKGAPGMTQHCTICMSLGHCNCDPLCWSMINTKSCCSR